MVEPLISVCIANYNGENVLLPCIESVLRQQCAAKVEIIIHDDASTDASVALLATYHPGIRLIRSSTNVGFCVSNNRMAEIADGDYLLLLNNDARLREGALQCMLERAVHQGFSGILSVPQYALDSGCLLDYGCRIDPFLNPVPATTPGAKRIAYVMGACLWIPRALWRRIHGFPEWLGSIGEDIFLCLAAWQAHVGVEVIDASGYDHAVGYSFGGGKAIEGALVTTYKRRFLSERNRTCVMAVFCPTAILPLMLLAQIATSFVEGVAMLLVKRDARVLREVYLSAIASAWRLRHTALSERAKFKKEFGSFSLRRWLGLFSLMPRKLHTVLRHGIPDVR